MVVKGAQLHEELLQGLAAVCGNTVERVSLEFIEPQSYADRAAAAEEADDSDGLIGVDISIGAEPESTSEITVPMGASKEE